jgi:glucose/arabinose dehydrogenase
MKANYILQSGEDTWAPSGIAFVNQGPWQGKLLVAALRGKQLFVIHLTPKRVILSRIRKRNR